ncbi:pentapeptide repeat-containing protein [Lyngbya aestuarii]|uniref:pentapeptide repeat-containing protein n=1 Tax=Lyngbya aestuarii TaxID=118322 RepID=UPI00403E1849
MEKQEFLDLLEQGVDSWNFWREKNLDVEIDLSEIDLSESDLSGVDFSGVNLSGSNFSEANLQGANLRGADLQGADFSEAELMDADLSEADLDKANLSKAHLADTNLCGASLVGANLSEAYLLGTDLSGADLRKVNLSYAEVIETNLSQTDLKEAYLNGANFSRTDLSSASLRKANLGYADILGRDNTSLTEGNLSKADLQGANLSGANLSRAEFYGANLTRANLANSQAADAQFAFAKFTGAVIEDWQYNEVTNFNGVTCDFVYLDSSRRKPYPVGRRFAPGEFTKVFQKSFENIDVVISNPIDFGAFVYSFKAIQAKYENAHLDIQSKEEKGENIFVVKVGISPDVDQKETHADFMELYESIRKELEQKYKTDINSQIVQYQQETDNLRDYINNLHNILQQQTEVQKLMAETPKYDLRGSKFGGGFAGDGGTQIGGTLNDYSSKQSLDEAAAEIQQLLQQLEETNPTTTETEKMIVAAKAADEIKNNPTLKGRVIGALQSGGTEAFKEAVDNPVVNILVAIIEGWMQAE